MRIARGGLRTGRDEVILVLVMAIVGCSSSGAPSGPSNDAGGRDVLTGARDAGAESALDAPADAPRGEASVEVGADSSAPSCGVPFALTGPWCTKLPASTPLASNSAAVVANIQEDIKNNYGTFSINTDSYSAPLYTVAAGAPTASWA